MDFSNLTDEIAILAHRCFCMELLEEGWRPGATIDFEAKTHDALKPYHELTAFQKERLREAIELAECNVEDVLRHAGAVALRAPEFCLADMHVGREVRDGWNEGEPAVGRITGWTVADQRTGRLATITVEWPDGSVAEYDASEDRIYPAEWPEDE